MAEKSDPLDVAQLAKRDLTKTAFPGGKQDFRIFFERAIHERIAAHAAEKLSLEVCGVLVGQWHRDADGPFVLVDQLIRCDKAVSHAGDVKLTHEDWNDVNREMDTKFTDRAIVGWYHSHPNFGIFLSEHDCFIQEYTFNAPGHIAYVVDPVNGVEGVFAWRDGKVKLWPHFWVGQEIHLSAEGTGRTPSLAPPGGQPAGQSPETAPKQIAWPPLGSMLTWVLGALCLLLLGYLAGGQMTASDRNMLVRGVVAHYGLFKGLKPGLRENLGRVDENLQKIRQVVAALAKEHISLAGEAQEERKKQWAEIDAALEVTDRALNEIKNLYSLTPEEADAVQQLINAKEAELENLRVQAANEAAARDSGGKTTAAKTTGEKPAQSTAAPAPAKKP